MNLAKKNHNLKKTTTFLMSKKIGLLLSFLTLFFISCEGEPGPPGFDGLDGLDGLDGADGLIGQIFEVEANFTADNEYAFLVDIPAEIEVFDSDIVIAYVLSGVDNDLDIWEPLPQTLFFDNDILLYGFDYTVNDVRFFLDGTIDLSSLDPLFTEGIIFRVAVIPADFAKTIDVSNMHEVMQALKIKSVERLR